MTRGIAAAVRAISLMLTFAACSTGSDPSRTTSRSDRTNPAVGMAAAGAPGSAGQASPAGISGAAAVSEDDAGQPPLGGAAECAKAQYEAKLKPLDMMILLDQSGSMTEHDDRWTPVTLALQKFVSSPAAAGMGVGLQYFPLAGDEGVKCAPATYAPPAVPSKRCQPTRSR